MFEVLDPDKRGVISAAGLRHKLDILMPGFAPRDVSTLFSSGKREISESELCALLLENEIVNSDPVKDVYDKLSTPITISSSSTEQRNSTKPIVPSKSQSGTAAGNKDIKMAGGTRSDDGSQLDLAKLKSIFQEMNLGALTSEELDIIGRVRAVEMIVFDE